MTYSPEVKEAICVRLEVGESLASICKDENMPSQETVFSWIRADSEFSDRYARARELQAEWYLDQIIEIADDCTDDVEKIASSNGELKEVIKHSAIQRAKLQIDARKWTMSKLAPKKYGNKVELTGDPDRPLQMNALPPLTQKEAESIIDSIEDEY